MHPSEVASTAAKLSRLNEWGKVARVGANPSIRAFDLNQAVTHNRWGKQTVGWPSSPAAAGHLWSKQASAAFADLGTVKLDQLGSQGVAAAKLSRLNEWGKVARVGANPSIRAFDLNQAVTHNRWGKQTVGWPSSPAAAGHLWSKQASAAFADLGMKFNPITFPSSQASPESEAAEDAGLSGVAASTWDFAEQVGRWAQCLPDRDTRAVVLNLGGVLISCAAVVLALPHGGSAAVAPATWMMFHVISLINSIIDKLQK